MRALLLALFAAGPAAAASCPPAQDVAAERAALIVEMRQAPGAEAAAEVMTRFWLLQTAAPDPRAQELLDRGMVERTDSDLGDALAALDQLIAYCPEFTEGYNQRAFVEFLASDYQSALADVNRVLAAEPDHVAALSGKALVLMGLGRVDEAQSALRAALALNPWLPERGLLIPRAEPSL